MKKILIFTAGFGEGHNTAARSLLAALKHLEGGEVEVRVVDLFAECYGAFNDLMRKAYIGLINRAPKIWERVYHWLDKSTALDSNLCLLSMARARLETMLDTEKPDAVVSTYPVYNYLLRRIYGERKPRPFFQITIVTDSITINSVWYRAGSDYFVVPNEDTAQVFREKGVAEEKIKVLGFPVAHRFATGRIERGRPVNGNQRVLYMINAGKSEASGIVKRLLGIPGIQLTVTVGRDEALQAAVEREVSASGRDVQVLGWTDRLPELLMSHHLLISKAGGATVQETIAAKTPMLILQVVPGQEEGNARLLIEHECGALTGTTDEIVRMVGQVFQNGTQLWEKWEANITKLSRPDASLVIARFVLDTIAARVHAAGAETK